MQKIGQCQMLIFPNWIFLLTPPQMFNTLTISYLRFMRKGKFFFTLLFSCSMGLFAFVPYLHPYHVSITEIRIDPEKKAVNISCKMFTDDIQDAMSTLYKVPVELLKKQASCDSLISKYVHERLEVSVGGMKLDYKYIGYEIEEESVWCYFESALPSAEKSVKVRTSILYDFLDEQANFLHCYYKTERKSFKLENPDKEAAFTF